MGYNPQESLENAIKTMGTVRGTPNCPLIEAPEEHHPNSSPPPNKNIFPVGLFFLSGVRNHFLEKIIGPLNIHNPLGSPQVSFSASNSCLSGTSVAVGKRQSSLSHRRIFHL